MVDKITLTNLVNLQNETTAVGAINSNNAALTTAIDNTVSRDGSAPNQMGANFDMNSNRILNLPIPISTSEPATYGQLADAIIGSGGIPIGGTTGQLLNKTSNADYAVSWTGNPAINSVGLNGSTSGTTNLVAIPIASGTITVPSATDTLVGKATTDTLTNKTLTSPVLTTPILGTPASGTLTNCTGLPITTGISGLGTSVATFLATPSSANLATAVTGETGSGALVFGTSPAITTPTGIVKGDVGLGNVDNTSDVTKNAASVTLTNKTLTSPVMTAPVLGTPASGTLTNCTGLPLSGHTTQAAFTFVGNNTSGTAVPTAVDIATLTTKASPAAGDYAIISDQAASGAWKKTTVSSLASAGSVASIAGNTGAFTLDRGVTNSTNAIRLDMPLFQGKLFGLTLSTAGSSATFGIALGYAVDSTAADFMRLASAYTKTTSAWAVGTGNGGIDTGAVANSTWYHVHLIKRLDTGVTDVLFSLSATAPTMPTNYTLFRRIGCMKTNGSAQWTLFQQLGDTFLWDVPAVTSWAAATSAALITLIVPTGIKVKPIFTMFTNGTDTTYLSSPDTSDQAPSNTVGSIRTAAAAQNVFNQSIWTNTSAQIRARADGTTGSSDSFNVQGWIDERGRLY